jgi:hypothetical protein
MRTTRLRRRLMAVTTAYLVALAGTLLVGVAGTAWAYWTDRGVLTSGTMSSWQLGTPACTVTFGQNQSLTWPTISGTSYTVSITNTGATVQGLSFWTTSLTPSTPVTTTGGSAAWGIGTNNPIESSDFGGNWTLVATAPGGAWTATRTGTWTINYAAPRSATCTVNP